MKKIFLRRIFPATLLLTVALTFNFIGYSTKVQAKDTNSEKLFITTSDGLISDDKYVDILPVPENFDATKATDEELKYYNFPGRPKDSAQLDKWKKIVSCKWIKPKLVETAIERSTYNNAKHSTYIEDTTTTSSEAKINTNVTLSGTGPNWAGYVNNNPAVMVYGEWVVPKVSAPTSNLPAYSAQWIGLGGYCSKTLVQAGTGANIDTSNSTSYYPWYELLGTNYKTSKEVNVENLTCKPGDEIVCKVTTSISGSTMTVTFFMSNLTTKKLTSFNATVTQFNNVPNSAEWIAEDPVIINNGVNYIYSYPLTTDIKSNENAVRFAGCSYNTSDIIYDNNDIGISNASKLVQFSLANGTKILAQPTLPGTGTWPYTFPFDSSYADSFNVNWRAYK